MTFTRPKDRPSTGAHNLPDQLTPLVGRDDELAEIIRRLTTPGCRLLTLVGPGGIGKTRLAIEAGGKLLAAFPDGVYCVALQPLEAPDLFIATIADALNLSLAGAQPPPVQLAHHLSPKKLLLILDNFEHLPAAAPGLTGLLQAAPDLKMLVTSREALNLQEEWLYQVEGLPYPMDDSAETPQSFGAVQLFARCAQRVRAGFSLDDEQAGVVEICRLVEGTPLALELAASWAKSLTCADIAAEIRQSLDFLATRLRNVPGRHRSMAAVFNHSWALLDPEEQAVFKRVSVFRGSFRRPVAEAVAGASLMTLTALVDKSLLRWTPDGRYQMHELLRQYAATQLAQSPEDVAQVYDAHCAYYLDFLHQRRADVRGGRQQAAAAEIEQALENIRAAWQWAIQLGKVEEIQKVEETLDFFFQFRGRYLEAIVVFEKAVQSLDKQAPSANIQKTLIGLLLNLSWFYIRVGRLAEAEAAAARCRQLYQQLNIPPLPKYVSDPQLLDSILALIRGDYADAAANAEAVRQRCQIHPNVGTLQTACYLLARAALLRGEYETAGQHIQQAHTSTQTAGDDWFRAYCLIEMGNIAAALKQYAAATGHYRAAYALRRELGEPEGQAVALNHLGEVALRQADFAEAEALFEQSRSIYREIGDRGGLATALNGLARSAVGRNEPAHARQQFQKALTIATEMEFTPLLLSILAGVTELLARTGPAELRAALLRTIIQHPASHPTIKEEARLRLEALSEPLPPAADLTRLLADVRTALAAPVTDVPPAAETGPESGQPDSLIEPLTEREIEVLQLMADGLTNPEIAERLIIATGTVKYYTGQIYGKLGVRNRVEAVARARELKLL